MFDEKTGGEKSGGTVPLREINHDLRNANQYVIPYPRMELFKKSLLYSLPTQWQMKQNIMRIQLLLNGSMKDQLIDDLS
jgi:hypothetical protein